MEIQKKIYWKDAIFLLKEGKIVKQTEIDFKNELIPALDVAFLNRNNLRVPENLVFYNDEEIDYSDDPEITEEDLNSGKIQWMRTEEFPIDNEIRTWIINQNIKLNELLPKLLKDFYETMKQIQNKAAF